MMDDGRWTMDDGRWTMDDGRWTMDDGRWTMDDGRWLLSSIVHRPSSLSSLSVFAEELYNVLAFSFAAHYLYKREPVPGINEGLCASRGVIYDFAVTTSRIAEFQKLVGWLWQFFNFCEDRFLACHMDDYYF